MEERYYMHLNMLGNQIKNGVLEKLSTEPVTGLFEGRIYYNNKHNSNIDLEIESKIKFINNHKSLNQDDIKNLLVLNKNFNFLLSLIYNNFKKYFETGDLVITGSYLYNKINFFKKDDISDIDISILKSNNTKKILNELIVFFSKQYDIMAVYIDCPIYDKLGTIYTKRGIIDIVTGDHNNQNNETTVELMTNVYTKFYGFEWIVYISYRNIKYMYNDLEKENVDNIEYKYKTIEKYIEYINIIMNRDGFKFKDKELESNVKKLLKN